MRCQLMENYKIRIVMNDKIGVLNRVTALFSRLQINIKMLTMDNPDCSGNAEVMLGFRCTVENKTLLLGRLEKIHDVLSVEEIKFDL